MSDTSILGVNGASIGVGQASNPWFNIANQFIPRNLKDVIRWSKYITTHSPTTTEVIRKLSTYPITEFIVDSKDKGAKDKYKDLIKSFKLRQFLHDVGFDYFVIGNVFVSVYFPIHRDLTCPKCLTKTAAKKAPFAKFKAWKFIGKCPHCDQQVEFQIKDTKSMNVADMNLIKWNPIHIAVNNNPITGESEYYYTIPQDVKRKVMLGDPLFINTLPMEFLQAVRYNQDFKFDTGSIFHLKNVSTGAMVEGVAIPPILSMFGLVYYQAVLRRANESIAQEHLTPLRVIYPGIQGGNGDPVVSMSMKNFVTNMSSNLKMHKKDRNHVMIAPLPVGYQNLGGEGRTLLVSQEIQQAEEQILMSLGVSRELLSGTTNWTSSTVGLRMLTNTLSGYTFQIEELIEWIFERASNYLSLEKCKVTLEPFQLTDDDSLKQFILNGVQTGSISQQTMFETFGIDQQEELDKRLQDGVKKAKFDIDSEYAIQEAQFAAAKDAGNRLKDNEDLTKSMGQAQEIAQQLLNTEDSVRRSQLHQLKVTNYPIYLMVSKLIADYNNSAEHKEEVQGQSQVVGEDPTINEAKTEGVEQQTQQPQQPG